MGEAKGYNDPYLLDSIDEIAATDRTHAQAQYFECLSVVHQINVLVYSRSKGTRTIARKLRAEVKKLFVESEVPEASWLIEKHNSDPDVPGIGLIVADYDKTTISLLDFFRKRATDHKTMHLPLILTILLMPEVLDKGLKSPGELMDAFPQLKIELLNIHSSTIIFERILQLARRYQVLESDNKELRRTK